MPRVLSIMKSIFCRESNRGQRVKRLIMFMAWQLWKRTIKLPVTKKLDFNSYKVRLYPDCVTSSNIVYFKDADFRETEFLRQTLNGGLLLDIGANVGIVTLSLADKVDGAILFEPNAIAADRAKENLAVNHLPFEVHEVALSDREGYIYIEDRGGPSGVNRVLPDQAASPHPSKKVSCTTLDKFLSARKDAIGDIAFIKIDVEGHEVEVLRGMKSTLEKLRPRIIMFEYLQRTNFDELREIFDAAHYQIYSLNGKDRLQPVSDQPIPLRNLFALPREE